MKNNSKFTVKLLFRITSLRFIIFFVAQIWCLKQITIGMTLTIFSAYVKIESLRNLFVLINFLKIFSSKLL